MKKTVFTKKTKVSALLMLAALCISVVSCAKNDDNSAAAKSADDNTLVIYTYDSFASDWGPAAQVIPPFEEKYGIKVDLRAAGDAGAVLSRIILEKESPKADIMIGLDNNMLAKALESDVFEAYKPENASKIPEHLVFDESWHAVPFDYGYFSINYDSTRLFNLPASLEDLTKEEYADSLILMDPRTSSPGLGFMLWTVAVYGDDFTEYWKRLGPSVLTITDGWDTGYGMYTTGEAPMVLSYNTSPPVHVEYDETDKYRALIFEEGNYMQIEAMAIVKNAQHRKAAEKFIEYMLTDDFQNAIPLTNFMLPVNPDTKLPDSYQYAPDASKTLLLSTSVIESNLDTWLEQWLEVTSKY